MNQDLHVVFVSELAPGQDHAVFGALCRAARSRHAEIGVGGVLLFDGQRFLQWLYGPREQLATVIAAHEEDERHAQLRVLLEVEMPPHSRLDRFWRAGFVDADRMDALLAHPASAAAAVFERLHALIDQADLDPPALVTKPLAKPR